MLVVNFTWTAYKAIKIRALHFLINVGSIFYMGTIEMDEDEIVTFFGLALVASFRWRPYRPIRTRVLRCLINVGSIFYMKTI